MNNTMPECDKDGYAEAATLKAYARIADLVFHMLDEIICNAGYRYNALEYIKYWDQAFYADDRDLFVATLIDDKDEAFCALLRSQIEDLFEPGNTPDDARACAYTIHNLEICKSLLSGSLLQCRVFADEMERTTGQKPTYVQNTIAEISVELAIINKLINSHRTPFK